MADGTGWMTTGRRGALADTPEAATLMAEHEVCGDGTPESEAMLQRLAVAELAEGIAHDLKNQLTVVAASVQLAKGVADGGRQDLLERAWRAAMRAARLMDEMLRYTHGIRQAPDPVDAAEALETAVAGAWSYFAARGVQLEMRLDGDLPRVVGSAPAVRVLLLHALRGGADRSAPRGRLVAQASVESAGVRIRLLPYDAAGQESHLGGAAERFALLEALADQAGVTLEEGGQSLLLTPAGAARPWDEPTADALRASRPGLVSNC